MPLFTAITGKLLLSSFFLIFISQLSFAQNKVDLELKAQTASDTARGGEIFSYTVIVSNRGSAKATQVILLQADRRRQYISALPSAGICEKNKAVDQVLSPFRCMLGDIEPGAKVAVNFQMKIFDFSGEPEYEDEISPESPPSVSQTASSEEEKLFNKKALENTVEKRSDNRTEKNAGIIKSSIDDFEVRAKETEENTENNSLEVVVKLLPSKNLPPRLQIISPQEESVITRRVNKPSPVTITIKAFDSDGSIEKVLVDDPQYQPKPILDGDKYNFLFEDKIYTAQQLDDYMQSGGVFTKEAVRTGTDTYIYTLKNLPFGPNRIMVTVVDDGGRIAFKQLELKVRGDAEIEIVTPQKNQVLKPNSTITIETVAKINDPALKQLRLMGTEKGYAEWTDVPLLDQVSKVGTTFKHRYVWKNIPEGISRLQAVLLNDSTPTNQSKEVTIIVAEPRVIKITSLENGQKFKEGAPIKISVAATDIKGQFVRDELELFIDGKYQGTIPNSWMIETVPPYEKMVLNQDVAPVVKYLLKGTHTIKIVAKGRWDYDGIKLGESETITVIVG